MNKRLVLVLIVGLLLFGCTSEEPVEPQEPSTNESPEEMKMLPTKLYIQLNNSALVGQKVPIVAKLIESGTGDPLAHKKIIFSGLDGSTLSEYTNDSGEAKTDFVFSEAGTYKIQAEFGEYGYYEGSKSTKEGISVSYEECSDGTIVGNCSSLNVGYYCNLDKQLVKECSSCPCGEGLVCFQESCISEEEKEEQMFLGMMKSVVKISHSYGTGSGVILERIDTGNTTNTIVLTNRHVVEEASGIEDISVLPYGGGAFSALDTRLAPNELDLAVITVSGDFGSIAQISPDFKIGDQVSVVGAPLGLQSSVSGGVISNTYYFNTDTGYSYRVIQTDAPINPGNSGGGLFLSKNNLLIGIPSLKIVGLDVEGIGYAIDISELDNLPSHYEWESLSPTPKCWDGTPYGNCSETNIGYYCSSVGNLIHHCSKCGCAEGYACALDKPNTGECFYCPEPYVAYIDGTCCDPGYYWVDTGKCCPEGTILDRDGKCRYGG